MILYQICQTSSRSWFLLCFLRELLMSFTMQGTDLLIFPSCGRHCSQVSPDSILHCKLSYYKLPLLSWLVALERNFYLCNIELKQKNWPLTFSNSILTFNALSCNAPKLFLAMNFLTPQWKPHTFFIHYSDSPFKRASSRGLEYILIYVGQSYS